VFVEMVQAGVLVLLVVVFIVHLETCALSGFTSDFITQMLGLVEQSCVAIVVTTTSHQNDHLVSTVLVI
jgi:hypothetical protein